MRCGIAIISFLSLPLIWIIIAFLRILTKQYISIYDGTHAIACIPETWGDAVNWGSMTPLDIISLHAY